MKKEFFQIDAVDGSVHIFRWASIDWVTMDKKADLVMLHIKGESLGFPGKVGEDIWEKWISIVNAKDPIKGEALGFPGKVGKDIWGRWISIADNEDPKDPKDPF